MGGIEDYIIDIIYGKNLHVSVNYNFITIIDNDSNDETHFMIYYNRNCIIINKDFDNPYEKSYDYMKIFSYLNSNHHVKYWNHSHISNIFMDKLRVYNRDIIIDSIIQK